MSCIFIIYKWHTLRRIDIPINYKTILFYKQYYKNVVTANNIIMHWIYLFNFKLFDISFKTIPEDKQFGPIKIYSK